MYDNDPTYLKYIPKTKSYTCAALIGGIIQGILEGAGFECTIEV